jgi:hypothetical protein
MGVVNVEPEGSTWYRSQVTQAELALATTEIIEATGHPIINYQATYPGVTYKGADLPILRILNNNNEIVHGDINAVIIEPSGGSLPTTTTYPYRHKPFREFTVVFHDEVKVVQAFPEWYGGTAVPGLDFTLTSVKDAFAINYGTGGIGSEIIANRLEVGPMADCVECKYEEFFLSSWTVGDPAMIVDVPATVSLETGSVATKAFYPDDPANVWHSYLNDRVKVRNVHFGTEFHIFHLHAHQWLFSAADDQSNYLDSQAIGPGSSFTYEIAWGGSGNRNKTPGDSIFHCHFYPHFAQGMWGLWRIHDVFESGTVMGVDGRPMPGARALPDGEIAAGTPIPAVIPMPGYAMAPMPGEATVDQVAGLPGSQVKITEPDADSDGIPDRNPGYPFWVGAFAGHRPPTPPLDLVRDGGLPRHVITEGTALAVQTPSDFTKELLTSTAIEFPEAGTPAERKAMEFHAEPSHPSYDPSGNAAEFETNGMPPIAGAPFADPCRDQDGWNGNYRQYKAAVIELPVQLNKVGWHFNQQRIITLEGDVTETMAGTRPPEPFVMRANAGDCIDFDHTNLVPHIYQGDDFQVTTPTDVIGQHIHLVKFDVTSADGAANGFNYEDGTFSPGEIEERIHAIENGGGLVTTEIDPATSEPIIRKDGFNGSGHLGEPHARTTRQRWYVDPLYSDDDGKERGLGNVFTHDHYGPSTHQQVGLYGTLIVEPSGSTWHDNETGVALGSRSDGGPTSWAAVINNGSDSYREFYLEFADFQLAYRKDGTPVNPSDRKEIGLPDLLQTNFDKGGPRPEAISAADPGTFVVNYRNEPVAHRVLGGGNTQNPDPAGDLANAFQSRTDRAIHELNQVGPYPPLTADVGPGDPFTPIMRAYEGDQVRVRVQVGAHEEGHNFSIRGLKWLQQSSSSNSGYVDNQMMGISEWFSFELPDLMGVDGGYGQADYLYQVGSSTDAIWNGAWGLIRSYNTSDFGLRSDLVALPNNPDGEAARFKNRRDFRGVCPRDAFERKYTVVAVAAADALPGGSLIYNSRTSNGGPLHDPTAMMYVLDEDLGNNGMLINPDNVEPLILRANAGDCILVEVVNRLPATTADLDGFNTLPMIIEGFNANDIRPSSNVGLHAQKLKYNVIESDGGNVGRNPVQTAAPGQSVSYMWYAGNIDVKEDGTRIATPVEFGAINLISADPIEHASKGLIGALIVEPEGSTWQCDGPNGSLVDCYANQEDRGGKKKQNSMFTPPASRASATISYEGGNKSFRDFVVIFQDDVNMRYRGNQPIPIVSEEEEPEDSGQKGINYRTEPRWFRLGHDPNTPIESLHTVDNIDAFTSNSLGEPQTPIFTAKSGDEIRFRLLKPGGHNRNHVFTLHGHLWARHPFADDSTRIVGVDPADSDFNQRTFWHGEQMGHGPGNHFDIVPVHGAGGKFGVRGDYLLRDQVPVHFDNGIWGILRVQ